MKPTAEATPSTRSIQIHQHRVRQARLAGSLSGTASMMTPIVLARRRPRGSGMNRQELALLLDEALALTANVDSEMNSSNKSTDSDAFRNVGTRRDDDLKK